MPAAAQVYARHKCPMETPGTPPIPHETGGNIITGDYTVYIGGLPAARVGDKLLCKGPPLHPDTIATGSASVRIGGKPAAREGDLTSVGGKISTGNSTVSIGG